MRTRAHDRSKPASSHQPASLQKKQDTLGRLRWRLPCSGGHHVVQYRLRPAS